MSQILLQPANAMITLENVNKWYGQFHVLKNINLTVQPGERIVLCGPSGSGKSTTIRCINHLEEHQQGRIVVDGIELNEDIRNIARPAGSGNGLSAFQSLPSSDRSTELYPGTDLGTQDAKERG